jgi:hypothetical protein
MDSTAKTDAAPVQERPARRKFLDAVASGLAGTAAMSAPTIAKAQNTIVQ